MIARTARQFPLIVALVLVLALVPAALAAKPSGGGGGGGKPGGGTGGSGSIAVVMVTDANANGLPNYGDTVTFKVSDPASSAPHLQLQCFQSGAMVYTSVTGYYASYPWPWTQDMTLSTGAWTGGGASCTATLYHFTGKGTAYDGTMSFAVGA